ncbi:MAG: transcriptional regulator [Actinobacteria bacterium]|nr:transcriptional regulator [Actinomycetota bacterium]
MSDAQEELAQSIGGVHALAAMLRRVRADRNLSADLLALRIERPVSYVCALERARAPVPTLLTVALLAYGCEVSVSLFVASFALPLGDPLPWPREHQPPGEYPHVRLAGPRAFGAALREERYRLNWSTRKLAARARVHRTRIGTLERGQVGAPTLLTVTQLAHALGATPPRRIAYATQLAQSYAGEIPAPRLRRIGAKPDLHEPPNAPDACRPSTGSGS